MKALQITSYDKDIFEALDHLQVVTKDRPIPGYGEVLIKVEATPCNPSDLRFLQRQYGITKTLPAVPGWEGAGTVIATGGGLSGWWLKGKRVAFGIQSDRDGTWAEYCVADAKLCIPLKESIPIEQGAALIINPLTAIGLMQVALSCGHKALVQNAAASQLGRMIINLAARAKVPLINIVRRLEQVDLLKSLGAQYVLHSEDPQFFSSLQNLAAELNATCAFDAVAGESTGMLLNALPNKSTLIVHGGLSGNPCGGISPIELIFQSKKIEGFLVSKWTKDQGTLGMLKVLNQTQNLIADGVIKTAIFKTVTLEEAPTAIKEYVREMSQGKVIIKPSNPRP